MFDTTIFVNAVVFAPLINFIVLAPFNKKIIPYSGSTMACLYMFTAFVSSFFIFFHNETIHIHYFDIFNYWCDNAGNACNFGVYKGDYLDGIKQVSIGFDMYLDNLSKLMLFIITSVSFVVHIYSSQYMQDDENTVRFMAYISLFTFCMLMLIGAKNFIQMFFGWEGVGVCSYLLIGFWYYKDSASAAANKAFIVNRIGDCALIIAIMMIWRRSSIPTLDLMNLELTAIESLFLFIGCMGKSAQIFLHVWLPDAMEGPTPVSALIHAATMVTAGVFLLSRVNIMHSDLIAIVGGATAVFAATTAVAQNDIKKIIAYSTCSQLGYMFMAVGAGSSQNAMFHLGTHAFFKAMLFLCAGNVIHAVHEQDIRKMGGLIRKLPVTYAMFLLGSLAIIGFPPFAGYYSKDAILEAVHEYPIWGEMLYLVGLFAAFCTAIYSMKIIILVFHGQSKISETKLEYAHEANYLMLIPKVILVLGSIFSGIYGYYFLHITDPHSYLLSRSDFVYHPYHDHNPVIVGLLGCVVGFAVYRYRLNEKISKIFKYIYLLLANKYYFDEIYDFLFVGTVKKLAALSNIIDKAIDITLVIRNIDYVSFMSKKVKSLNNGYIISYAIQVLIIATAFSFFVVYKYVLI